MKKFSFSRKKVFLCLLIIISLSTTFFIEDFISVEALYEKGSSLINWAESSSYFSILVILALYIVVVALSIPVATILTTFLGFLFGYFYGALLSVIGASLGAAVLFGIFRWGFGYKYLESIQQSKFFKDAQYGIAKNLYKYLIFIRIFPIIPFWVANILPPLLGVRFKAFILTTIIGIAPGTFLISFIGHKLRLLYDNGSGLRNEEIYNFSFFLPFFLLSILVISPLLYKLIKNLIS